MASPRLATCCSNLRLWRNRREKDVLRSGARWFWWGFSQWWFPVRAVFCWAQSRETWTLLSCKAGLCWAFPHSNGEFCWTGLNRIQGWPMAAPWQKFLSFPRGFFSAISSFTCLFFSQPYLSISLKKFFSKLPLSLSLSFPGTFCLGELVSLWATQLPASQLPPF